MLGISPSFAQKFADIDVGPLAARSDIGVAPDEYVPGSGIALEKPSISPIAVFIAASLRIRYRHSLNNGFGSSDPHPPVPQPIAHDSALDEGISWTRHRT
jgi:hypothetical protein